MTDAPSTGRQYLTEQQYKTDANLAARQSIYAYLQPRVDLWGDALDLAHMNGDENVLDVGCGNGSYVWLLGQRGHRGFLAGMDLSLGMLDATRARTSHRDLMLGDAQSLPFADASFHVVLAMHMLYHLPDRALGISELRRVVRNDGVVLVVTNSQEHMRELDEVVLAAAGQSLPSNRLTFTLESGESELRAAFSEVVRHDVPSELVVTEVEPVIDYLMSMRAFVTGEELSDVVAEVRRQVRDEIDTHGAFRIRTRPGCFACRP